MIIIQGIANGLQSAGKNMQYQAQQRAINAQIMANNFHYQNVANAAQWNNYWSMVRQAEQPIYRPPDYRYELMGINNSLFNINSALENFNRRR